jgi:hypothetical protein
MIPNKTRRHTAKRCRFAKRQAIIYALANHESVESIRKYHKSRHTVLAIREQYSHEIETAQARIKGQSRRITLNWRMKRWTKSNEK